MTETKLPTIENFESGELTLRGILNAHEKYAKEQLEDHHGSGCACEVRIGRKCDVAEYWRGRLEAIQYLRGKK